MSVTLLSNIPHYHYLAEALHAAGLLDRYITANALLEGERPPVWLPDYWARKLSGRRIEGVPAASIHRIRLPELLQRALPMAGVLSAERGNWLNNQLFDRMASLRTVASSRFLHFVSSVACVTARRAKRRGQKLVCDVRQEHPRFQREILADESARWGVPVHITGESYEDRVLEEFAMADWIVVPSGHAKRTFLACGFGEDRVVVNGYGVDLSAFQPQPPQDKKFRVLYAGSITLRKGVQYLLESWKQLRLPDAELVLVGNVHPSMRGLMARYEGLFRHVGSLPKLELAKYYSAASVFVLPSLADSFSLGTLEAMACGTPVLISQNTGAADIVSEGLHGWVTPIRSADAISERLLTLYREPGLGVEMGNAARAAALRNTWAEYGARAVGFYHEWSKI